MNSEETTTPTEHTTPNSTANVAVDNTMIMGILSYLGPLVIIPLIVSKDVPFVKFHIKQGLVLLGIQIIAWALLSVLVAFWMFINLINLALLVLTIVGIVNVVQHKEKELPLVGQFAKVFTF